MKRIRRIGVSMTAAGVLVVSACSSTTQIRGTVTDIGGQDDAYSIQLRGSDKVWECYAPREPICRLLKKGDAIAFLPVNVRGMNEVSRENTE